ncbi:MAG: hypothetical protein ACYDAL_14105 [Candidatus Dormibacteraceae bacterium]
MATEEELLDILLQLRATGQAEAVAVNQILANTGNVATTTATQVGGLTAAHEAQAVALQTAGTYTTTYGEALTAQEASLARAHLSSKEMATVTHDVTAESNAAARAMGAYGAQGARVVDRMVALGGAMGTGGPLGIGIGAAIIGLGGAYEAAKSFIEIADKNEAADKSLAQAYTTLGEKVPTQQIDTFINANQRFIPSIAATKEGFASLARAGFDNAMQMRLMNDALDLSAAKNIDLGTSINTLLMAESGRATGLLQLGINVREIADPQKELTKAIKEATKADEEKRAADRHLAEEQQRLHDAHKVTENDLMTLQDLKAKDYAATQKQKDAQQALAIAQKLVADGGDKFKSILDQVEPKIKGARDNTSDLQKAQHRLGIEWDRLANQVGPPLESVLGSVTGGASDFIDALNNAPWDKYKKGIQDDLITPLQGVGSEWDALVMQFNGGVDPNAPGSGSNLNRNPRGGNFASPLHEPGTFQVTNPDAAAGVPTSGASIVPPIVEAAMDAKRQAQEDARLQQQQSDRLIRTLERVETHMGQIEANTRNPIVPRLAFNVQGLAAADQQTARLLRRAMQV